MAIGSVSSSVNTSAAVQVRGSEETRKNEVENDGDKDDGASGAAAQAAQRPTVNTSGQTIGSVINVQA